MFRHNLHDLSYERSMEEGFSQLMLGPEFPKFKMPAAIKKFGRAAGSALVGKRRSREEKSNPVDKEEKSNPVRKRINVDTRDESMEPSYENNIVASKEKFNLSSMEADEQAMNAAVWDVNNTGKRYLQVSKIAGYSVLGYNAEGRKVQKCYGIPNMIDFGVLLESKKMSASLADGVVSSWHLCDEKSGGKIVLPSDVFASVQTCVNNSVELLEFWKHRKNKLKIGRDFTRLKDGDIDSIAFVLDHDSKMFVALTKRMTVEEGEKIYLVTSGLQFQNPSKGFLFTFRDVHASQVNMVTANNVQQTNCVSPVVWHEGLLFSQHVFDWQVAKSADLEDSVTGSWFGVYKVVEKNDSEVLAVGLHPRFFSASVSHPVTENLTSPQTVVPSIKFDRKTAVEEEMIAQMRKFEGQREHPSFDDRIRWIDTKHWYWTYRYTLLSMYPSFRNDVTGLPVRPTPPKDYDARFRKRALEYGNAYRKWAEETYVKNGQVLRIHTVPIWWNNPEAYTDEAVSPYNLQGAPRPMPLFVFDNDMKLWVADCTGWANIYAKEIIGKVQGSMPAERIPQKPGDPRTFHGDVERFVNAWYEWGVRLHELAQEYAASAWNMPKTLSYSNTANRQKTLEEIEMIEQLTKFENGESHQSVHDGLSRDKAERVLNSEDQRWSWTYKFVLKKMYAPFNGDFSGEPNAPKYPKKYEASHRDKMRQYGTMYKKWAEETFAKNGQVLKINTVSIWWNDPEKYLDEIASPYAVVEAARPMPVAFFGNSMDSWVQDCIRWSNIYKRELFSALDQQPEKIQIPSEPTGPESFNGDVQAFVKAWYEWGVRVHKMFTDSKNAMQSSAFTSERYSSPSRFFSLDDGEEDDFYSGMYTKARYLDFEEYDGSSRRRPVASHFDSRMPISRYFTSASGSAASAAHGCW